MTWLVEDKDPTPPGEQMAALWKRPEILRMPGAHTAPGYVISSSDTFPSPKENDISSPL